MTPHQATAQPSMQGAVVAQRFVLEARLGSGRFGEIYQALDKRVFDEVGESARVALQIVRGEMYADSRLRERFRRGFRRVQRWSHPNVVKLLELGREDDTLLLTMELLQGASLRFVLDDVFPDTLELEETLALIREVGSALRFAHESGMTHGDVRPENVFVTFDHCVKVLDFLPMPVPTAHSPSLAVRNSGGDTENATDVREDVYGLACLAYELLSGEHPYGGSPCAEARRAALVPRRIEELRSVQWTALVRGLALSPEQRTPTIAEFLNDMGVTGSERLIVDGEQTGRGVNGTAAPESQDVTVATTAVPHDEDVAGPDMRELQNQPQKRAKPGGLTSAVPGILLAVAILGLACAVFTYDPSRSWRTVLRTLSGERRQPDIPASAAKGQDSGGRSRDVGAAGGTTAADNRRPSAAPSVEAPPAPRPARGPGSAAPVTTPSGPAVESTRTRRTLAIATTSSNRRPATPASLTAADNVVTVSEAANAAAIVVRRNGGASGELAFQWRTRDSTALGDADYGALGQRIETLGDGERERTVYVPIVDDAMPEPDETFYVDIRPVHDPHNEPWESVKVVVTDDDR